MLYACVCRITSVGLDLCISIRAQAGGIGEEVAAAVEGGKAPHFLRRRLLGEAGDEVLCSLTHDFRQRPILPLGNLFEPLIEGVRKMNLSAFHDMFYKPREGNIQYGDLIEARSGFPELWSYHNTGLADYG